MTIFVTLRQLRVRLDSIRNSCYVLLQKYMCINLCDKVLQLQAVSHNNGQTKSSHSAFFFSSVQCATQCLQVKSHQSASAFNCQNLTMRDVLFHFLCSPSVTLQHQLSLSVFERFAPAVMQSHRISHVRLSFCVVAGSLYRWMGVDEKAQWLGLRVCGCE